MIIQMAAAAVKAEYAALGMDTGKLQTNYILQHRRADAAAVAALAAPARSPSASCRPARRPGWRATCARIVFKKVESFSNTEFDKFSTASLITRSTNDITQIQMVVIMMMRMVFYAPIIGVGGIIRAIGKSASMWWIIAAGGGRAARPDPDRSSRSPCPSSRSSRSLIDRLNLVTRENLSGMMVIRAFNMQEFEEKRFDKANRDLTDTSLFVNRVMVVMMPVMMLIMNGLSLLIIWVGAHQVAEVHHAGGRHDGLHAVRHADRVLLPDAVDDVHHPAARLGFRRPHRRRAGDRAGHQRPASPEAVPRALHRARSSSAMSPSAIPAREEDVLHDISFTAQPGQTTAFIGSTGSGKSTIVNLIPRFYDVTERRHPCGRHGHPRGHAARPARQDRLRPAEEHAVLRHDREQPALCR